MEAGQHEDLLALAFLVLLLCATACVGNGRASNMNVMLT
jgi:hypothetical protein